jgi:hypothetical protein
MSENLNNVFTGRCRYVQCRDVSALDCSTTMSFYAAHCGNPDHVRVIPVGQPLGQPLFRERPPEFAWKRPPRLTVDEDFDLVGQIDPDTFDPDQIWVAKIVQQRFTAYHCVGVDEAFENICHVMRRSVEQGSFELTDTGAWEFCWRGFWVLLSADLSCVIGYRTRHNHRTPLMVDQNDPGRFRAGTVKGRALEDRKEIPDDFQAGQLRRGVVTGEVGYGVFISVEGVDGLVHRSNIDADAEFEQGAPVVVRLIAVHRDRRQVDLAFVGSSASLAWAS